MFIEYKKLIYYKLILNPETMKKDSNNQITMHTSVKSALNENADLFELITAFVPANTGFDKSISIEQELAKRQLELKSITTTNKNAARDVLSGSILDLSSKLMSYALIKGDNILYDTIKLTKSEIKRSTDNVLVFKSQIILTSAQDNLEALADYNVSEQTITDDSNFLENFNTEIQKIEDNKNALSQITLLLDEQIKITNKLLKPIDSMVESMRKSNWAFYCYYWNARTIRKSGGSKISAKGKVYDSATNMPLPGAVLSVVRYDDSKAPTTGADLAKNVKIKSAGGGFQLKSMATGTYLFTVTYAGYTEQEVVVYINEGILTHVEIPLTRLAA
jgi:protocatechuate 3,4-dioxygenase beta subunit